MGFEAAWSFFGGVFGVVIPDNLSRGQRRRCRPSPAFNDIFLEYSQARGFFIDRPGSAARPTSPGSSAVVHYVRHHFFAGEQFRRPRRRPAPWPRPGARSAGAASTARPGAPGRGLRRRGAGPVCCLHRALQTCRSGPTPKVHRDHHVEVARALYSVPGSLIGTTLSARADARASSSIAKGQLVKVHPRMPRASARRTQRTCPKAQSLCRRGTSSRLLRLAASHGATSGSTRPRSWTHRCPGPRCARSIDSGPNQALWARARRAGLCEGARGRGERREPGLEDDRASLEAEEPSPAASPGCSPGRFARDAAEPSPRARPRQASMALGPTVPPELGTRTAEAQARPDDRHAP